VKITVIGATGMVGSRVVAEAASRGHEVVGISRTGSAAEGATSSLAVDLGDSAAVLAHINGSDATVIAVPADRTGGSHEPLLDAHKAIIAAAPTGRVFVVGGFGSLLINGVPIKDSDAFPAAFRPTAETMSEIL
jgi:putative NADH-flavin reductase